MILLPTDQEVPGSIPGYAVRLFSSGEQFHDMNGLNFSVLQNFSFMFSPVLSSEEAPSSADYELWEALQLCPCTCV